MGDDAAGLLARSSFRVMVSAYRRTIWAARKAEAWPVSPSLQLPYKLRNFSLAESHGIPVPDVYRVWSRVEQVSLDGLPDRVVVKSDRGAGAHSVFPLERDRDDPERWALVDGSRALTVGRLRHRLSNARWSNPPFYAEQFLPGRGVALPDDIKVYCFYGVVGHILIMRPEPERVMEREHATRRYVSADGTDLGQVLPGARYDPAPPVPEGLDLMVRYAQTLSRVVGVPFCRVDFLDTEAGPVLGEITQIPGGAQHYTAQHDKRLGQLWAGAEVRHMRDLVRGRPAGAVYGDHDYSWHYPPSAEVEHPSSWRRVTQPCGGWC